MDHRWFLVRNESAWTFALDAPAPPAASFLLPQDAAWRLFTKGLNREKARALAVIEGHTGLADPLFTATSILG